MGDLWNDGRYFCGGQQLAFATGFAGQSGTLAESLDRDQDVGTNPNRDDITGTHQTKDRKVHVGDGGAQQLLFTPIVTRACTLD